MFDYAKSANTANRLLTKFGQIGAIRRTGAPTGDPWDPQPGDSADHPCRLAVLPIELQNAGLDIDGTLIKSSDRQILVSVVGLEITPTTTDKVVTSEGVFTILRNNTLAPAGIAVLHDIVGSR